MLLSDLYVDLQIEILSRLSGPDLLRICQVNRYYRELFNKLPHKLDNRFKESTREMFGIPNKLTDSWYATFLILYNDLMKTSNRVINECRFKTKDDLLRKDLSRKIANVFRYIINDNKNYCDDDHSYYRDDESDHENDFTVLKFRFNYDDKLMWIKTKLRLMIKMEYNKTKLSLMEYNKTNYIIKYEIDYIIHQFISKYLPSREDFFMMNWGRVDMSLCLY